MLLPNRCRAAVVLLVALAACSSASDDTSTATSTSISTSPVTTSPVTTSPVTTSPVTTSPVTTSPMTTAPATAFPVVTSPADCGTIPTGVSEITVTGGGHGHPVRIFVPSSFDGTPLPTVLDWHGLGSNGGSQAMFTGYESLAESEGFIVVHPTGVELGDTGLASWQLAAEVDEGDPPRDDLVFAHVLIDRLISDWCAEPTRIYSTGMSNGGYFTARLVCELSDRIAAAVSVAATFHPDDCTPDRTVPYAAYHGTADVVVPFDGSGESVLLDIAPDELATLFSLVMPDELAEFAADAGCTDPAPVAIGDDVIASTYTGCDDGVTIRFFEVTGGGHTWPGSPIADALGDVFGYTTDTVDATLDGWAFMSQYRLEP